MLSRGSGGSKLVSLSSLWKIVHPSGSPGEKGKKKQVTEVAATFDCGLKTTIELLKLSHTLDGGFIIASCRLHFPNWCLMGKQSVTFLVKTKALPQKLQKTPPTTPPPIAECLTGLLTDTCKWVSQSPQYLRTESDNNSGKEHPK